MALQYPYSEQAERAVLGSMIFNEEAAIVGVATLLDDDFYLEKHKNIFTAIKNIYDRKVGIDITTISNELVDMKCLEDIGGVPYLVEITDNVVSDNYQYYIDVLKDKTNLRIFAKFLEQTVNDFDTKSLGDINEYLNTIENDVLSITRNRHIGGFKKTSDVVSVISEKISRGKVEGLSGANTGYPALNYLLQGWQPGDLIILAARPGVGKSALALNFAYNTAYKTKGSVAFFSLEMPAEHLVQRMIAARGLIDSNKLKTLNFDNNDHYKFADAAKDLSKQKIFIDDTPGLKLLDIQDKARKLKSTEQDLKLIIIDYLNLISIGHKTENRQNEVAEITRGLKALARELKVPVIALAQLSRGVEQRGAKSDHRPGLSDLRESGAIEQDADIVMFIYREDYYKKGDDEVKEDSVPVELIVDKHRNGARGTIDLIFSKSHSKFTGTNDRPRGEGD